MKQVVIFLLSNYHQNIHWSSNKWMKERIAKDPSKSFAKTNEEKKPNKQINRILNIIEFYRFDLTVLFFEFCSINMIYMI